MALDLELIFNLSGMAACVVAAAYLFCTGNKKIAALLFLGFTLHLQSALYMTLTDSPGGNGACWYDKGDFYACLPLGQKLSIHAAQVGHYLLALGVLLLALSSRPKARASS